jgi:glycosyltransferase involved in cell wall biosynthesis
MKIATFGARFFGGQISRIEEGFQSLGHQILHEKSDIIYCNDQSNFTKAIEHKQKFGGLLILNILDIPFHLQEINDIVNDLKIKLKYADRITCISKTTKFYINKFLNINAEVVYNPAKEIKFKNLEKTKNFLSIGRLADPNKRFQIAFETIKKFNQKIYIAGSDCEVIRHPSIIAKGIIDDSELENLYNTSKFYLATSYNEGICLPMIESLMGGCIPIVCNDMTTASEFIPEEFLCDPDPEKIATKIYNINKKYKTYQKISIFYGEKYSFQFNKVNIAKNILSCI